MIFVMTMMYEIKVDNWRTCIFYLPDLLGWPDLARRVNSHHVRGCLFAIWSWQEKYFMRIRALSWKFTLCQLISNELKFQILKWWAFVVNIFAKQYWLSENLNFQCNFHIFTVLQLQSLSRWIINEWLWIFLETVNENVLI